MIGEYILTNKRVYFVNEQITKNVKNIKNIKNIIYCVFYTDNKFTIPVNVRIWQIQLCYFSNLLLYRLL